MSYNKRVWANGDLITKESLNNIENGIYDAHKEINTLKNNTSTGGGSGEVDLSGYVTRETGNASQITFADGQTFQAKLDTGTLKGDKGDKGDPGEQGPQGIQGEKGDKGDPGESSAGNINDTTASATTTYSSNKIESIKENLSSQIKNKTYKCEDIGELYSAPSDYTAWCPGNLRFDKTLNKFVALLYCAPSHGHSSADLYVSYINKEDFVATNPVKCKYVDSDGITDITPSVAGTTAFMILEDGTYMMLHNANDNNTYRFISSDNGLTWVKNETVVGFSGSPWGITKLSNGRLIFGDDSTRAGIYYSDDGGINWERVIPGNEGIGDYVAEAHIIELKQNNLIAIARKSIDGYGYANSTASDHAIISYSTNNGTTWSDWEDSTSIDNMEASCCTSIVHDGIVEIFTCSRWHNNSNKANQDYTNTGKNGAIFHYVATIDSALKDNFTNLGVVTYAKASNADDFHSPCLSLDNNNNILIMYMDKGNATTCNHSFIRGELGCLSHKPLNTNSLSSVNPYSAKYTEVLLQNMLDKINTLQYALSQIPGSGVTPPSGTLVWTKQYNANTDGKSIIDSSLDIANYITGSEAVYTQHNDLYCTDLFRGFVCMEVSKQNCAFDIKVSSIDGKSSGAYGVGFGLLKNGILYYLPYISNCYKLPFSSNEITEIKVVFNDVEISEAKWNAIDIKNLFSTYDDLSAVSSNSIAELILINLKTKLGVTEIPTTGTYLLIQPCQTYLSWYEVKLGEWD